MAAAQGLNDGCYRRAVFRRALLHCSSCRHLWQEGTKAAPRHRKMQSKQKKVQSIFPSTGAMGVHAKNAHPAEAPRCEALERENNRIKHNLQLISLMLQIYRRPNRYSFSHL